MPSRGEPVPNRSPRAGSGAAVSAAPTPAVRTVRLGPLSQPARFTGCDDLIAAVRSILRGWDVVEVPPDPTCRPPMRVKRTRRGYRRVSRWLDRPSRSRAKIRRTLVDALCGFHYELIDWYAAEHPEMLFVHGAAVAYGERLVLFPALAKAGKSTLTVRLALEGRRVFCDDVLPIQVEGGRGWALGIVPRLRPPLPADATPAFREFVGARPGHGRRNRLYVSLEPHEMAAYGETAPIGAVVLLERTDTGRARLTPEDPADALERVLLQNFGREVPTPRALDTLADVVLGSTCWTLRYASLEHAVALLEARFGAAPAARRSRRVDG